MTLTAAGGAPARPIGVRLHGRRLRLLLGGLLLGVVVAGGCARGGEPPDLVLDGSPRLPDAEGLATVVESDRIQVGGVDYRVSPDLVVFSTHNLELTPLLRWEGAYVQVGLDGDVVAWLAGVGGVISGEPPSVLFTGQIDMLDGDRVMFRGGTVFRLEPAATRSFAPGSFVIAEIDPVRGIVRRLDPT
ncbi:MAG TPA: hypothetical protein VGA13_03900 [Acidimicrobiales bacterium]